MEERLIRRIGEATERAIDVRVIAATHHDLQHMVHTGTFREDLWYRLNVAVVQLPALRDRGEDIELLAFHFLHQQAQSGRGPAVTGFEHAALDAMNGYAWPGNVRQLRSAVERACIVATSEKIELTDLPPEVLGAAGSDGDESSLTEGTWSQALERGRAEVGRRYLQAVMSRFDGQVAEAAAHAGVERESFYRLLRKHGVEPNAFRSHSGTR